VENNPPARCRSRLPACFQRASRRRPGCWLENCRGRQGDAGCHGEARPGCAVTCGQQRSSSIGRGASLTRPAKILIVSALADCGNSLPPLGCSDRQPRKPLAFLAVARLDYRSPAFAGNGHGWLVPWTVRAAAVSLFAKHRVAEIERQVLGTPRLILPAKTLIFHARQRETVRGEDGEL